MIKLTSINYSIWKPKMEDILYYKDMYDPVEKGDAKPDKVTDEDWKKLHRKAVSLIRQWVDLSVFHHVATETNAQTLWKNIEKMYQRKTAQNKTFAIRKLVNLKYREGKSVVEHLSDFQDLVNQLVAMKLVLEDELQALLLLSSLPESWETLVVSLSNSAPDGQLTLSQVKDSMFNEETRRKDLGASSSEALVTENKGRNTSGGRFNESRDRSESQSRRKFNCYHCGEEGHIKRNCKAWKNRDRRNQRSDEDENTATPVVDGEVVLLSVEEEECHVADSCVEWVVDSAASYHATSNKEFFMVYKVGDFGRVKMGNSSHADIVGIGDVCIQTNTGCTLTLKDVRHVPDLRHNLISVQALDLAGFCSNFGNGTWKLTKGSLMVARGTMYSTLYRTQVKLIRDGLNAVEGDALSDWWHKTLARISEKGLRIWSRKSLIPSDKGTMLNPYDYSLFGKHHGVSFSKTLKLKDDILDMVYSDVSGSMKMETIGGSRYFVMFIDDVSQKVKMAKMSKPFWSKAIQTTCYLINKSPFVPLGFGIHERVWSGHDISYSHLKVFGCKAFAHVSKEQRQKLDDIVIPCILVGYGDEEFGYKLWDPEKRRIIRSRDVVFHEQETMSDSAIQETPTGPPIRIATVGGDLVEDPRVDGEPAIEDGDDEEYDEDGKQSPTSQFRSSNREYRQSNNYPSSEYILIADEGELESVGKIQTRDNVQQENMMQEEIGSLQENVAYEFVKLSKGLRTLKNKLMVLQLYAELIGMDRR